MRYERLLLMLIGLIAAVGVLAYIFEGHLFVDLLCVLVFVLGCWGSIYTVRIIRESLKSYKWKRVKYRMVDSKVVFVPAPMGKGNFNAYKPHFTLEYEFSGRPYRRTTSEDLNLHLMTTEFPNINQANKYLNDVQSGLYGDEVLVNPEDPTVAYLRAGVTREQIGMLIFSLVLAVMSLLTLLRLIEWQ